MSSRLLSMKSANALLELPSTGQILGAGTSLQTILLSDIGSCFPLNQSGSVTPKSSSHPENTANSMPLGIVLQERNVKVAILTISDTVAFGVGPDRRYFMFYLYKYFIS